MLFTFILLSYNLRVKVKNQRSYDFSKLRSELDKQRLDPPVFWIQNLKITIHIPGLGLQRTSDTKNMETKKKDLNVL